MLRETLLLTHWLINQLTLGYAQAQCLCNQEKNGSLCFWRKSGAGRCRLGCCSSLPPEARRGLRGIPVLNQQACVVCRAGHPAESMSLITTMPHIYSKLTPLTPKSLFPQLGLLGPFIRLNSLHKALVTSTVLWKLHWDGKGRVEKK